MHKLELNLEEPERIFFSGDDVKGEVVVNLEANIAVQAVTVKFIGEACVSVPEGAAEERTRKKRKNNSNKICPIVSDNGRDEATPGWIKAKESPSRSRKCLKLFSKSKFSAKEKYFLHNEYLYGHKYSSYREQLWAGSHVFPFHFTLPAQLPASFNGRFGYVRYYCETTLLRWKLKDSRRVYFSVTNVADINTEAKADSGCEEQKTTNSCLFCCPRGTIVASAELKRRGYAPGEIAPLLVEIHNMSNSTISSLKVIIVQTVSYSSTQGTRRQEDDRKVLEVSRGEILPGTSLSWGSAGIRLPPLPPSSFSADSCKIIIIHYRIDVIMQVRGEKQSLILRLPLIVGNIPLKKHFSLLDSSDSNECPNSMPEDTVTIPRHLLLRYPKLPRATSEKSINPPQSECVYKLPDFRPRYLVYTPKATL